VVPISNHAAERYCKRVIGNSWQERSDGLMENAKNLLRNGIKSSIREQIDWRMEQAMISMGSGRYKLLNGCWAVMDGGVIVTIVNDKKSQ